MAAKPPSHWPITLTNGAAALFNLFLPLALVRILSPEEMGRYKIFFLYVMLGPGLFLVSGLNNGLYHWAGKYPESKPEIRQSWTLLVSATMFLCFVGLIVSQWLSPVVRISSNDLRILFVCVPFIIGAAFLEDLMIARGDIWAGSLYASGFNVCRAACVMAAAWSTHRVEAVVYAFTVVTAFRALAGWLWIKKSGDLRWSFSWNQSRAVLRYALPVSIAAASAIILHNVDQMILSFRLLPAQFAFYAIGCLSVPPLDIFEISVNRVLIPGLSRTLAAKQHAEAAALFREAVSELFRYLMPATIGLILYAHPIIEILFTKRYSGAASYLQVYALTYLFVTFPFDALARARADGGWIVRTYLFFSLLCVVVTWFAAGQWGAMGALLAVLSSQLLMRLSTIAYAQRALGMPLSAFIPWRAIAVQSGLAFAAIIVSLVLRPLFSDAKIWFLVTGPIFTLLYLGGTYALFLRRHTTSSGPIHVIELAQSTSLGGLERMIYTLSQELVRHPRFKVLVAAYDQGEKQMSLASQFDLAGIPLVQWQKGKGFSFISVIRLVRLIFSEHTHILHVHNLGPLIYGSIAKYLCFGRVRLVVTLHSLTDLKLNNRNRFYLQFFLRFADRIIAVSENIRERLVDLGVPAGRVEVIPNGVCFSEAPDHAYSPDEKRALRERLIPDLGMTIYQSRWILCLARLHSGKGQDIVLELWRALPPDVRGRLALFFVGQETEEGYRDWLAQKICQIPDSERIFIAGPSNYPQDWVQASDLFISGSLQEGMPLAPLEAAGSGLPTVLSDIEGHHFLKPWAYYFDPQKPDEGAHQILQVLDSLWNDHGVELGKSRWDAAAALRQRWSAPAMTASYAEAFQSHVSN